MPVQPRNPFAGLRTAGRSLRGRWLQPALLLALCVGLAACIGEDPEPSQARNLIVVGDSLSAGHQNGCTVQGSQEHGYAKVLADQAGWPLVLPRFSLPGVRPCMEIFVDGNPASILRVDAAGVPYADQDDANASVNWGVRLNPIAQPTNLGTPGTTLLDAVRSAPPLGEVQIPMGLDYPEVWKRFLDTPDHTPDMNMFELALALVTASEEDRDVVLLWLGSNDALWAAISGFEDARALTSLEYFQAAYTLVAGALAATGAELVVANIPDLTVTPHFIPQSTAIAWSGCNPGGLSGTDLITLTGLLEMEQSCPATLGTEYILTQAEVATISQQIAGYNAIIADTAAATGATLVDIAGLLADADLSGYPVGAEVITTAYCGGIFSLDGVHPTNTGYAVVANAFIAAMNAELGYAIPPVDAAAVLANESRRNRCIAP